MAFDLLCEAANADRDTGGFLIACLTFINWDEVSQPFSAWTNCIY